VQKPVVEPPKEVRTGSNLVDQAGIAVRCDPLQPREAASTLLVSGATVKACGVAVDRPAGEKLDTDPVERSVVNVGAIFESPTCWPAGSAAARHVVC
jgi:hypothetical protein